MNINIVKIEFYNSDFESSKDFVDEKYPDIERSLIKFSQWDKEKEIYNKVKKNNKEDQHYVAQFYIKKFYNDNKKIEVFDVLNNRLMKPKVSKGICRWNYFYSSKTWNFDIIGQLVEELLKCYEDAISLDYDDILINIENNNLSEEDLIKLSEFIIVSYTRSKWFRSRLWIGDNDSNILQLEFINPDNIGLFANEIRHKSWNFYRASKNYHFITSDEPVIDIVPTDIVNGPFNQSLINRTQFITLSPKILLEIKYNEKEMLEINNCDINKEKIYEFNKDRLNYSKFAYSCCKNELEDLLCKE